VPAVLSHEFDPERLLRRLTFLLDRAVAHEGHDDNKQLWHRACAATLRRDAAAIAVLRGDRVTATRFFAESGNAFAELGMFVGYSLLEFSQRGSSVEWRRERPKIDQYILRAMNPEDVGSHLESWPQPFLRDSINSPRQFVHFLYALKAGHPPQESYLQNGARSILQPAAEKPLGPTGIPLGAYVNLVEEVSEINTNVPRLLTSAREIWLSAILRRQEQLRAARADSWHWLRLLNPADVIDFDLMTIALLAVDRAGTAAPLEEVMGERDPVVALPLHAARLLRPEAGIKAPRR